MTVWRNLNIGTKVLTALLPLILLSIVLVSSISIDIAQRELEKQAFNKLIATREIKAAQVENYFSQIRHQIETFSENHMVISAMKDFATAFKTIAEERNLTPEAALQTRLAEYYQGNFLPKLADNSQTTPHFIDYFPNKKTPRPFRIYILRIIPINWDQNISLIVQMTTAGTVITMRDTTRSYEVF